MADHKYDQGDALMHPPDYNILFHFLNRYFEQLLKVVRKSYRSCINPWVTSNLENGFLARLQNY